MKAEMIQRNPTAVPPKLGAGKSRKINLIAEEEWLARIDEYRKRQPGLSPTRSEVIRKFVDQGLDAAEASDKPAKPRRK